MFGRSDITFINVRLLFALIQIFARQSAGTPVARCFIGDDTAAAAPYAAFDRAQHRDCRCDHAVAVEERSTHYADAQRSVPITTSWIRHRITSERCAIAFTCLPLAARREWWSTCSTRPPRLLCRRRRGGYTTSCNATRLHPRDEVGRQSPYRETTFQSRSPFLSSRHWRRSISPRYASLVCSFRNQ